MTATDSSFTVDIDNDLDIESVETEDTANDTPVSCDFMSSTSFHVDDIKSLETEPVKVGTSKRKTIGFYTIKPQEALKTPRVLIAFDGDNNEKPPSKEMRKQVLQHALE